MADLTQPDEGEVKEYFEQIQKEIQSNNQTPSGNPKQATTMFGPSPNENLIKWQLDIKEELERIEHLLRKHIPRRDEKGNEYFEEPDEATQLFNEKGVQEILHILAWYLNKNLILSNFSEEQINQRVYQFANTFTDFIFNNYHEFGLADNEKEKIKHFPMIVMNVVNTVEASYNRALKGEEKKSLRTARQIQQTEQIGKQEFSQYSHPPDKKRSLLKPWTWGG